MRREVIEKVRSNIERRSKKKMIERRIIGMNKRNEIGKRKESLGLRRRKKINRREKRKGGEDK